MKKGVYSLKFLFNRVFEAYKNTHTIFIYVDSNGKLHIDWCAKFYVTFKALQPEMVL